MLFRKPRWAYCKLDNPASKTTAETLGNSPSCSLQARTCVEAKSKQLKMVNPINKMARLCIRISSLIKNRKGQTVKFGLLISYVKRECLTTCTCYHTNHYTRCNRRTDNTSNIWTHCMHEKVVMRVSLKSDLVRYTCCHWYC